MPGRGPKPSSRYNPRVPKGEYLQYGGQAIIEGVMMRSPKFFSVAVRAPNGQIVLQTEALEKTWIGRQKWLKWPFLRGTLALLDAMALGYKALKFSANVQLDARYLPAPEGDGAGDNAKGAPVASEQIAAGVAVASTATATAPVVGGDSVNSVQIGATLVVALCFGLFLFVFFPNLIAEHVASSQTPTVKNLITGLIKIVFFLGYIGAIGLLPDIKRLFRYHGAEHKAINTLEDDQELTIENCRAHGRLHPRCGTSFAIVVLIVSLIVFTYVPRYPLGQNHLAIVNVSIRFPGDRDSADCRGPQLRVDSVGGKAADQRSCDGAVLSGANDAVFDHRRARRRPDRGRADGIAGLRGCGNERPRVFLRLDCGLHGSDEPGDPDQYVGDAAG